MPHTSISTSISICGLQDFPVQEIGKIFTLCSAYFSSYFGSTGLYGIGRLLQDKRDLFYAEPRISEDADAGFRLFLNITKNVFNISLFATFLSQQLCH